MAGQTYYNMISQEVEKHWRGLKARAKRVKGAFSNFGVLGTAARRMGEATSTNRSGAPLPNRGRPTR